MSSDDRGERAQDSSSDSDSSSQTSAADSAEIQQKAYEPLPVETETAIRIKKQQDETT